MKDYKLYPHGKGQQNDYLTNQRGKKETQGASQKHPVKEAINEQKNLNLIKKEEKKFEHSKESKLVEEGNAYFELY